MDLWNEGLNEPCELQMSPSMHDESNLSESANDRFVPRVTSKKSKSKCDSRYLETFLGENQPHKNGGVRAFSHK